MKKTLVILLCIMITITTCFCFSYNVNSRAVSQSQQNTRTVVIDAGHGGKDAGTIGVDYAQEKNINLEISRVLYDFLMISGINCVMIRNGDYELYNAGEERNHSDLYNRLDFINSIDNSVLISIHQNHFENEAEWGTQIWYSPNDSESKILADSILDSVKELIQSENKRENKESDSSYYLLYKATVPSIMIECGFMSNIKENELLQDAKHQGDMAFAIMSGICNLI